MLPTTFSSVRTDEQGRRYVVHLPSGVVYYVRDDHPTFGKKNKSGPVTTYSKSDKKARKEARRMDRLLPKPEPFERPRLLAPAAGEREYFATFEPVEGVK